MRVNAALILEKYGGLRPARYFIRSPIDLADVADTVFRQIGYYSSVRETPLIMRLSRCSALPIPNTLSSMILTISLPERILACSSPRNPDSRAVEMESDLTDAPVITHHDGLTCLSKRIANFFDLYMFHWNVRQILQSTTEGTRLWTAKRSASLRLDVNDSAGFFEVAVAIPGAFFTGSSAVRPGQ